MQRNNAGKKKRIITGSIATALAVTIIGTALYNDSSVALARPSLPGVENIVNENSSQKPFKILEIVDEYSAARIGYTIAGEEPGYYDDTKSHAISDMASLEERYDRYMEHVDSYHNPNGHSTEGTTPFNELVGEGKAATYTQYEEKDASGPFTAATEGVSNGKSYGTFVSNESNSGFYNETSNLSSDFLKVNTGDEESQNNLTINQIYNRDIGSDQTGIFWRNEISLSDGTDYDVVRYEKNTAANDWKHPYKIANGYTLETYNVNIGGVDTACDREAYDVLFHIYNQIEYPEEWQKELKDDKGTDDTSDDIYSFTYELVAKEKYQDGTLVYSTDSSDKTYLNYVGFISADSEGKLILNEVDGNGDVIRKRYLEGNFEGTVDESPVDTTIDAEFTDPSKNVPFAKKIADEISYTHYCTIVSQGDAPSDGEYYFIETVKLYAGKGHFEISTKLNPANDPTDDPQDKGIYDGTSPENEGWYHVWYYKQGSINPFTYTIDHHGNYDFAHDYSGDVVNSYYYKGGYVNNEWFKREVLDVEPADYGNICIDVITKKFTEVTAEDISNANLIYFASCGDYTITTPKATGSDFDYAAAKQLITEVVDNNKPVVLNLSWVARAYQLEPGDIKYNIQALLYSLVHDESHFSAVKTFFGETAYDFGSLKGHINQLISTMLTTNDRSHVTCSIFVNDDRNTLHDAIYEDFTTEYSAAKLRGFQVTTTVNPPNQTWKYSFDDVQVDIENEMFYIQVAGKDVDDFNSKISKATCIRHILNYGKRRSTGKTGIRVLDIEPYFNPMFDTVEKPVQLNHNNANVDLVNRDKFDKNWFIANVSDTTKADKIEIVGMGTKTFVGKIENLNENYDLIYIGMDTAYVETKINNNKKSNEIITNDGKKWVYRHIGDYIKTGGLDGDDGQYNMSGNDLTPDKVRDLQEYVEAGYAMIISNDFFVKDTSNKWVINETKVDPDSYMYKFIKWCVDEKYIDVNVHIKRDFESTTQRNTHDGKSFADHKSTFINYLNISKLEVDVKEMPPLYNPIEFTPEQKQAGKLEDVHYYIQMDDNGEYTMRFKVELTNDAAVDTTNTTYNCELYIDHDGDGRFEDVEKLTGLDIFNSSNDRMETNTDGIFSLRTGTEYTISRAVPEDYVGILPWKLVFIENGREKDNIKVAVEEFSAIRPKEEPEKIKILQLTSGGQDRTTLNLWNDANIVSLYDQVTEFDITVDHTPMDNLINKTGIFATGDRLENLCNYDMLVMGFLDGYAFKYSNDVNNTTQRKNAEDTVIAIREYMLTGRSVLFTHDLTSTRINDDATTRGKGAWSDGPEAQGLNWGYLADKYLRDIQGMDRFGFISSSNALAGVTYNGQPLTPYVSKYDNLLSSDYYSGYDTTGFCDPTLLRYNSNTTYGEVSRIAAPKQIGDNERNTYSVGRLNRGQITEYPFRIGEVKTDDNGETYYSDQFIEVARTHHQYFQLDLETDYRDDNYDDDIVVWYTLAGGFSKNITNYTNSYQSVNYMDARNNYYIYNKGNITYTGAGHYPIEAKHVAERKLFVNTLVAAFNAGTHAPRAAYKSDGTGSKDITSLYLPYDIDLAESSGDRVQGWLDTTITVYFRTVNNNLQNNRLPLLAQYYVEVPNGGDISIVKKDDDGNNITKHYKIIVPTAIENVTTGETVTDSKVLENGRVYKLTFNLSDITQGQNNVNAKYHSILYTRMRTQTKGKTIEEDKADMAKTGEQFNGMPKSDSFEPLNINFTQLYDLK